MKTQAEVWAELQKVRQTISDLASNGRPIPPHLTGAQQALGWCLGTLRSPSEAEDLIRLQHAQRKGIRLR